MSGNPTTRAIVTRAPVDGHADWKLEDVTLSRAIGADEVLVKMVASGICHSDLVFSTMPGVGVGDYPKVLGHEGAGYVQAVGSGVTSVKAGDAVLLSYLSCSSCRDCKDGHPSYCQEFNMLNFVNEPRLYSESSGFFFGQSSFANLALVKERSAVNVTDLIQSEEDLKLFAPMGCGFQTGMGTVDNLAGAGKKDSVVIMGLGGVGLSGIMAAKLNNCPIIIGVDRYPARLELAKSVGATHVINTSDLKDDLVSTVKSITSGIGASITVDTTGNMGLIGNGMDFTGNRGQMIILGVPPRDGILAVHLLAFMGTGKKLLGSIEGDVTPSIYIPKMIQWYREGKMPIDSLVKFYPVADFEKALEDMHSGVTVKPVLVW